MGLISGIYKENSLMFLLCMGKEERFRFDFKETIRPFPKGASMNLEYMHPYRVLLNSAIFSFNIIVPVLYYKIFNFRKAHDNSLTGNFSLD